MRWYKHPMKKCVIKKFAWLPITIGHETRWLETVYIRRNYYSKITYNTFFDHYETAEFVTKEYYEDWLKEFK